MNREYWFSQNMRQNEPSPETIAAFNAAKRHGQYNVPPEMFSREWMFDTPSPSANLRDDYINQLQLNSKMNNQNRFIPNNENSNVLNSILNSSFLK